MQEEHRKDDHKTQEAVATFRKVVKLELQKEIEEARLAGMLRDGEVDMAEYVRLTEAIEEAAETIRDLSEGKAASTRRQLIGTVLSRAGLSR